MAQLGLFGIDQTRKPPPGFRYQPDVISEVQEQALLREFESLPFKEFQFHGYTGNRRTVSFGWSYDFSTESLRTADDIPGFLLTLRSVAAKFAGLPPAKLQQALVIEYRPGAGIGWHRDKPVFGEVVGVSLLAPATFRLRRKVGDGWDRVNVVAEPRSAYLLSGESRTVWEHSIPPVDALRYSVTFRNLLERSRAD
ncbi:MAG TPA: alpha-ketoglutarate-dependent dioxygenase AlkB [Gemmatimonadaceae bacterium]|nr:alpha-ketoglutarate-dependent dioxygenase AlkB [Gemmatimonadaceae bacterium]